MSENNSEKAPKDKGRNRFQVAGDEKSWREAARDWASLNATHQWGDDEWESRWKDYCDRVREQSQLLATSLALQGIDAQPLLALARLMDEDASEWTDDDDGGDAKRLRAIAATERLLQVCELAEAGKLKTPVTPMLGSASEHLQSPEGIGFTPDEDDPPRYADPEEFGGRQVRIFVQRADGKSRSGFFKDGPWHENRWHGPPEPNRQEDMVCHGELETAPWFLIQYVLPRRVIGAAANDSFVDVASVACRRTPIQALHWFSQQAFGPPPALVERVRRFAAEWRSFCSSTPARAMLEAILQRGSVAEDDALLSGEQFEVLALLKRLELVSTCESGGEVSYDARGLTQDFGIDGYVAWTNRHLSQVALLIADLPPPIRSNALQPDGAAMALNGSVPDSAAASHWVPAKLLVRQNDERFSSVGKVTAFCIRHKITTRPGLTKDGKPRKQRRDVNLEEWEAKVSALDAEQRRLQDEVDRRTADKEKLKAWTDEDARAE